MKSTARYSRTEDRYDLDHEINHNVSKLSEQIKEINTDDSRRNKTAVIKALIETLLNEI